MDYDPHGVCEQCGCESKRSKICCCCETSNRNDEDFEKRAAEFRAENERLKATLDWYEKREGYVRALIGAVEDSGVFRDEAQDEWRQVVLWEQDNKKP